MSWPHSILGYLQDQCQTHWLSLTALWQPDVLILPSLWPSSTRATCLSVCRPVWRSGNVCCRFRLSGNMCCSSLKAGEVAWGLGRAAAIFTDEAHTATQRYNHWVWFWFGFKFRVGTSRASVPVASASVWLFVWQQFFYQYRTKESSSEQPIVCHYQSFASSWPPCLLLQGLAVYCFRQDTSWFKQNFVIWLPCSPGQNMVLQALAARPIVPQALAARPVAAGPGSLFLFRQEPCWFKVQTTMFWFDGLYSTQNPQKHQLLSFKNNHIFMVWNLISRFVFLYPEWLLLWIFSRTQQSESRSLRLCSKSKVRHQLRAISLSVVLLIFNTLITFSFACASSLDSAFDLDQDKDTTIRKYKPEQMSEKYVAMIHVVNLLQITLFPSLCGVHGWFYP
jgi:hypothetical protein